MTRRWVRTHGSRLLLAILLAAVGTACRRVENPHPDLRQRHGLGFLNFVIPNSTATDTVAQVEPVNERGSSFAGRTMSLASPRDRIPPEVLKSFQEETGATVSWVDSEGGVAAGEWDVILVPGASLGRLVSEKRAAQLDLGLIPGISGISSYFRTNDFDPGTLHGVPYLWSTAGIVYNFGHLDWVPQTWAQLLDPGSERLSRLAGRISLLPHAALAVGPALIRLGFSPNSTNADELSAAGQYLREQAGEWKMQLMAIPPAAGLLSEQVLVAECYGGDVAPLIRTRPDLLFVVPQDGTWERIEFLAIRDGMGTDRSTLAHAFINFLLEPKVAGTVSSRANQASTVIPAKAFVESAVRHGPAYMRAPDPHAQRFDHGSDIARQDIWREVTNAMAAASDTPW